MAIQEAFTAISHTASSIIENDLKFDPEALKVMDKLNKLKFINEQMKAKCQPSPLQNYSAGQIWNEIKSFGYDIPFTVFVIDFEG